MTEKSKQRSPAIAAAIILLAVGVAFYFLPPLMLWLGTISPYLAAGVGVAFVLAFFAIFWLRGRYQRGRGL